MTMDPLVLPITADTTAAEAALDQLGASMGDVQGQLARAGKAGEDAGTKAAAGIRRVSTSADEASAKTSRLGATMQRMGQSIATAAGQNFLEQLNQHTSELTRNLTGVEKSAADAGIALLGNLGVIGQVAQGALGVYGAIAAAEREQIERGQELARLHDEQARLGPLYSNIASSISATASAQERLNQTLAAERSLLQQRVALMDKGFSSREIGQFERTVNAALPTIRASNGAVTQSVQVHEVMAAVVGRNAAQLRVWGVNLELTENQALNLARATVVLNNRAIEGAQAAVTAARAARDQARVELANARTIGTATEARANLTRTSTALTAAERALTAAVERQTGALGANAAEVIEREEAFERAIRERQKTADADEARTNAAASANTSTLLERIEATRQMAEAEYSLSRARVQLGVRGEAQRLQVENALREEAMEHLRAQIALAEEDAARGRQRGENATQVLARQATALQRAATLTEQLATLEQAREQSAIDGERRIREAAESTARARADAALAAQRAAVDALIEQERERENKAREEAGTRRESDRRKLSEAQAAADAINAGPVNTLKTAAEGLNQAVSASVVAALRSGEGVGEALRATAEAQLFALATTSSVKALAETAEGFGALALGLPTAALHFKSAGLHALTAAAAGAAGAGVASLGGAEPAAGAGGGGGREPTPVSPRGGSGGEGGTTEVVQYYGPVIDGRASTEDQVGQRVNRYQRAGSMRLERQS